ncbi:hypothetical protein PHYC_00170 [Phycisphaerales bacterium]|nr:hypothetical protein PHYC_00170 [Phycisphaerales bacterium]
MNKIIIPILVLIAVGVFGTVGYMAFRKNKGQLLKPSEPRLPVEVTPPPDAHFLDAEASPSGIMFEVASMRKKIDQDQIAAGYVGMWVPETGWESEVVDITEERGGTAVRMYTTTGGIVGGFYIVAVVQGEPDSLGFKKGDRATVQGRIDKIEVLPAAATPMYRIVLNPARVLSFQNFGR